MIDDRATKYGYPPSQWEAAKDEAKQILRACARNEANIWYSDLTAQITAVVFNPHAKPFFHLLGQISKEEDEAGRGMMTAIIVHKPPGDC